MVNNPTASEAAGFLRLSNRQVSCLDIYLGTHRWRIAKMTVGSGSNKQLISKYEGKAKEILLTKVV